MVMISKYRMFTVQWWVRYVSLSVCTTPQHLNESEEYSRKYHVKDFLVNSWRDVSPQQ